MGTLLLPPKVPYSSREELDCRIAQLKTEYAQLVKEEYCTCFVVTKCWLHGPPLWLKLTKGLGPEWCEMLNCCLVQALETALFFQNDLQKTQDHFFDLERMGLFSDFVHANFPLPSPPPAPLR